MPDDLVLQETNRWLTYAREDLDAALALRLGVPRHACLHAQQSAEKAIKSIYVFLDMRVPRSHDLDMLRNLLLDGWDIKTRFDDLSELSLWAVESRYPGNWPEARQEEAEAAVALAKEVLACVEQGLRDNGYTL
jgi:HEPN domain-containing protein